MTARPQPREPSTQEVEAHVIDHCPFRSWCRHCVMAASRCDHHRRQTEEVLVISCDYVVFFFLQIAEMMRKDNSLKQRQKQWTRHQYSCSRDISVPVNIAAVSDHVFHSSLLVSCYLCLHIFALASRLNHALLMFLAHQFPAHPCSLLLRIFCSLNGPGSDIDGMGTRSGSTTDEKLDALFSRADPFNNELDVPNGLAHPKNTWKFCDQACRDGTDLQHLLCTQVQGRNICSFRLKRLQLGKILDPAWAQSRLHSHWVSQVPWPGVI